MSLTCSVSCVCLLFWVSVTENGVNEASSGSMIAAPNSNRPSDGTETDDGPADTASSDGEPVNPAPKRRHRRRTTRSETGHRDSSHDNKPAVVRKPPRAKSQPPIRRPSSRLDWTERQTEVRGMQNDVSVTVSPKPLLAHTEWKTSSGKNTAGFSLNSNKKKHTFTANCYSALLPEFVMLLHHVN